MLHPSSLPEDARLAANLGRARRKSALFEKRGVLTTAPDFADVILEVEGRPFRCGLSSTRSSTLPAYAEAHVQHKELGRSK